MEPNVGAWIYSSKHSRKARCLKRLRCGPYGRRMLRLGGGASVLMEEVDDNDTSTLSHGLDVTQAYLDGIRQLLDERTATHSTVGSKSLAVDDVKILTSHSAFVDNALEVIDELHRGLENYDSLTEDQQGEIFYCANHLFKLINKNIAPNFCVKMSETFLGSVRSSIRRSTNTCYEIMPGDDPRESVILEPGRKTAVPFFPPWKHNAYLRIRKLKTMGESSAPYWEGTLPFNQSGEINMENLNTASEKKKKFTFSYSPRAPCEPMPTFITRAVNLF